jgi:ribosomal protein S18 acetylase RimI-like enzyme
MLKQPVEAEPGIVLRDGRAVTIRPLGEGDRAALLAFSGALPEDDWLYLEDDFRNPDLIARLVNAHAAENWRQVVAVAGGSIVGYGAVRQLPGWSSHVADIRLIVAQSWRRRGLGTALALAVLEAARGLGISKLIVDMLEQQYAGQAIFLRLGFRHEGRLLDHARDQRGGCHNLVVMGYHVP